MAACAPQFTVMVHLLQQHPHGHPSISLIQDATIHLSIGDSELEARVTIHKYAVTSTETQRSI